MTELGPEARGVRVEWNDLPRRIRGAVEAQLGSRVTSAKTQHGGFSPGVAARLELANGKRAFVKAVSAAANPHSPDLHRKEIANLQRMPDWTPVPKLLGHIDEGGKGWVVLLLEDIDGRHPAIPWTSADLDRVIGAVAQLHKDLTPSPIHNGTASDWVRNNFRGWQDLSTNSSKHLDPWSQRNLDRSAALEAQAPDAVRGDTLLHIDMRGDNMLLTDSKVYFVDWPWALVGAPWFDIVGFAPSVTIHGGPDPEAILQKHPAVAKADPADITAAVAALAGYFTSHSMLPAPPGIPTLRPFQAAQGIVAREWLRQRTGWK